MTPLPPPLNRQPEHDSRTKTVATVGPACASREMLVRLIEAGADVFRLNMAHGEREAHEAVFQEIRAASAEVGIPCGILIDLAGPKIRLGELLEDPLEIHPGQTLFFVRGSHASRPDELTCQYERLLDEIRPGDAVVLADGMARLEVVTNSGDRAECLVVDGSVIRSRQGVNLPGTKLSVPALGTKDIDNAIWAAGQGADFVSLSFVREAAEMEQLNQLLREHGSDALTIAKIEKREALDNLEAIVEVSGGIMVARGDLGVEVDIWKTPVAQKQIIRTCLHYRKPVIVATQMLESMHHSKLPTRAEVSDVANAILDGADACMLSGETAIGQYPVDSVVMMQRIMQETEKMLKGRSSRLSSQAQTSGWSISDAVILGAAEIARRIDARLLVIATSDDRTALIKSKQRDYVPTICVCDCPRSLARMALYWGIVPVQIPSLHDSEEIGRFIGDWARRTGQAEQGDSLVIVTDTEVLPGVHDNVHVTQLK